MNTSQGQTQKADNDRVEILSHCIENFRFGIRDQNTSFNAMDVKTGVFMSTLVVLMAIFIDIILRLGINNYHPACQIVIYILGGLLFVFTIATLVAGSLTLKGRPMEAGFIKDEELESLYLRGKRKVLEEICAQANGSYKRNEIQYKTKSRSFSLTQNFWLVTLSSSLVFMLILIVLGLGYELTAP